MSSDESTSTQISTVSNKDETKTQLKSEQWEINLIGNYVLDLYHRSLITPDNDWLVEKKKLHEEYSNLMNAELSKRLNENGTVDIGTLLHRCGYLLNTPEDSLFYKIKYSTLFEFRNNKLKELDNSKINSDVIQQGVNVENQMATLLIEDNLAVDQSETKIPLKYQGSRREQRNADFFSTNMSCCICQEYFNTMDKYEQHIQQQANHTMTKFDNAIFKMSYRLCKNSHYFCFEIETDFENVIIEKIIIVQNSSFYYVRNMSYKCPEDGKDHFFVDSHLFSIHLEHPIVIICHLESSKESRIVEQHNFMRAEEFPKVNFAINANRLSNIKTFKSIFGLPDYFPPKEIQGSLKDNYYCEKLMLISNDFFDYVIKYKQLHPHNINGSLNMLLQIEDMDIIQQYSKLTQNNIKLYSCGDEYSFQLNSKQRVLIENILSAFDEVILTTGTDFSTNQKNIMNLLLQNSSDINHMTNTYVGQIQAINKGLISFKCCKKIDMHATYTVICRPSRLTFRYQYHALENLNSNNMRFLKKFLFPAKIIPRPLSTISLSLYNNNINSEQLQAVRNIAEGPRNDATYIIFGPPGTGKTTTLVEAILQLLKKPDTKVLVTASSNSACDEIAIRLCKYLKKLDIVWDMVRIYSQSCEARTETIDDELLENSNMYNGQFYPDIEILHEYRIVVCTLSVVAKLATGKFGKRHNGSTQYTHLFIDEVAASTEPEALQAITAVLTAESCLIISGDHKQLGPVLQSKRAKALGLGASLMDRLLERDCYRVDVDSGNYDRTIQTRLIRNYRSHPAIVNLYSRLYYDNTLESFAKKDDVSLCEIWHKSRNKQYPIMFHAIYESSCSDKQSHSLYNPHELHVVMDYVKDLMYFGINGKPVNESDIGIISPYKKQYKLIQKELNIRQWFKIETGSVETFQGKEKNIIIVSFVRSGTRDLGFLDCPRRLNVTISRPKSLLIMVGNPQTLSLNSDFEYIINECQRNNTFVGSNGPTRGGVKTLAVDSKAKSGDKLTLDDEEDDESADSGNDKPSTSRSAKGKSKKAKNKEQLHNRTDRIFNELPNVSTTHTQTGWNYTKEQQQHYYQNPYTQQQQQQYYYQNLLKLYQIQQLEHYYQNSYVQQQQKHYYQNSYAQQQQQQYYYQNNYTQQQQQQHHYYQNLYRQQQQQQQQQYYYQNLLKLYKIQQLEHYYQNSYVQQQQKHYYQNSYAQQQHQQQDIPTTAGSTHRNDPISLGQGMSTQQLLLLQQQQQDIPTTAGSTHRNNLKSLGQGLSTEQLLLLQQQQQQQQQNIPTTAGSTHRNDPISLGQGMSTQQLLLLQQQQQDIPTTAGSTHRNNLKSLGQGLSTEQLLLLQQQQQQQQNIPTTAGSTHRNNPKSLGQGLSTEQLLLLQQQQQQQNIPTTAGSTHRNDPISLGQGMSTQQLLLLQQQQQQDIPTTAGSTHRNNPKSLGQELSTQQLLLLQQQQEQQQDYYQNPHSNINNLSELQSDVRIPPAQQLLLLQQQQDYYQNPHSNINNSSELQSDVQMPPGPQVNPPFMASRSQQPLNSSNLNEPLNHTSPIQNEIGLSEVAANTHSNSTATNVSNLNDDTSENKLNDSKKTDDNKTDGRTVTEAKVLSSKTDNKNNTGGEAVTDNSTKSFDICSPVPNISGTTNSQQRSTATANESSADVSAMSTYSITSSFTNFSYTETNNSFDNRPTHKKNKCLIS